MGTMTQAAPRAREYEFTLPIGWVDEQGQAQRQVVLRKMTGREEAILADKRNQRNGGKLVSELLASCIVRIGGATPNGHAGKAASSMYSVDRNFLLLKLRSITFGPELEASYNCPHCGEVIRTTENLDELPVRMLEDSQAADEILLELEDGYLDRDGQLHTALKLRLPTGADEEAVAPQIRQNAAEGKNCLLARCMKSLGDLPKQRLEAVGPKIIAELTLVDRRTIDRALNQAAPGVSLMRTVECPGCGQKFQNTLDLSRFLAME
jgi:hypothetical protein